MLASGCNNIPTPVDTTPVTSGMKLVRARDSTFQMGSDGGQRDEAPMHTVSFTDDFWLDTTEVTQLRYATLMSSTYAGFTPPQWDPYYGAGDNYPARYLNWYDAALFCNARTKECGSDDTVYAYAAVTGTPGAGCVLESLAVDLTRSGFRLPTEAQWEYACRGGVSTDFFWGDGSIDRYAWYSRNSGWTTNAVAQKMPNAWGFYDMCGNVYEWCNDWYGMYDSATAVDPTGPQSGSARVLRGGSWYYDTLDIRCAVRYCVAPSTRNYRDFGLRACLPAR